MLNCPPLQELREAAALLRQYFTFVLVKQVNSVPAPIYTMRIPDERLGGHRKSEEKEPVVVENRLHFCHRLQVLVCEALSY